MSDRKKPTADAVSLALETLVDAGWDMHTGRSCTDLGKAYISVRSPDIEVSAPSTDELVEGLVKMEDHTPTEEAHQWQCLRCDSLASGRDGGVEKHSLRCPKRATPTEDDGPAAGDYVLATKYEDGDPGDHFYVGFVRGRTWHGRFDITDGDGNLARGNGFRRAEVISREEGDWLVARLAEIEKSGVSVWAHLKDYRTPTEDGTDG